MIWQWVAWIGLTAQLLALGGCKERGAPPRPPGVSAAAPQEQPPPLGYDPRKMLDEKTRASAIRPQRALSLLGLSPGMVVADIGAGPGYFTFRMARAVGPGGRVYALEIRDSVLKLLRRRSADRKLNPHQNVVPVNNREDDTNLRPDLLDLALLCEVHICLRKKPSEDEAKMMASIYRTIKPGGALAVLELKKNDQYPTYAPRNIVANFKRVGFTLERAEEDYSPVAVFYLFRKPRAGAAVTSP